MDLTKFPPGDLKAKGKVFERMGKIDAILTKGDCDSAELLAALDELIELKEDPDLLATKAGIGWIQREYDLQKAGAVELMTYTPLMEFHIWEACGDQERLYKAFRLARQFPQKARELIRFDLEDCLRLSAGSLDRCGSLAEAIWKGNNKLWRPALTYYGITQTEHARRLANSVVQSLLGQEGIEGSRAAIEYWALTANQERYPEEVDKTVEKVMSAHEGELKYRIAMAYARRDNIQEALSQLKSMESEYNKVRTLLKLGVLTGNEEYITRAEAMNVGDAVLDQLVMDEIRVELIQEMIRKAKLREALDVIDRIKDPWYRLIALALTGRVGPTDIQEKHRLAVCDLLHTAQKDFEQGRHPLSRADLPDESRYCIVDFLMRLNCSNHGPLCQAITARVIASGMKDHYWRCRAFSRIYYWLNNATTHNNCKPA